MTDVIVLQLNEVSPVVLRRMIDAGKCPNFRRLQQTHVEIPTDAGEIYSNLEPWIQWVTIHTGLSQAQHKVFNLSDGRHTSFDQLWDQLEDSGIACGIVAPINSRRSRISQGLLRSRSLVGQRRFLSRRTRYHLSVLAGPHTNPRRNPGSGREQVIFPHPQHTARGSTPWRSHSLNLVGTTWG